MDQSSFKHLIGCKFALDGKGPKEWNCGELILEVFRLAGIYVQRPQYEPDDVHREHRLFDLAQSKEWKETQAPYQDLDLVQVDTLQIGVPTHAAVYFETDGGYVLHATDHAGVVYEPFRRVRSHVLKVYRHESLCRK